MNTETLPKFIKEIIYLWADSFMDTLDRATHGDTQKFNRVCKTAAANYDTFLKLLENWAGDTKTLYTKIANIGSNAEVYGNAKTIFAALNKQNKSLIYPYLHHEFKEQVESLNV